MTQDERDAVLRQYAGGELCTRRTIEALGAHAHADLIFAMAEAGGFPEA
jgi:hypothetical protein